MKRSLEDLLGPDLPGDIRQHSRPADIILDLACGEGSNLGHVTTRKSFTWIELVERLSTPSMDDLTRDEFLALDRDRQNAVKAANGWYVAGTIEGQSRNMCSILTRCAVVMDIDDPIPEVARSIERSIHRLLPFEFVVHSTHKSTPDKPRFRVVVPLTSPIAADQYAVVARAVARLLVPDLHGVDRASFEAERLMYWPSHPADVEFFFEHNPGHLLDPDALNLEAEDVVSAGKRADWTAETGDLPIIAHNRKRFSNFDELACAVRAIINDDRFDVYKDWFKMIAAINFESGGSKEGLALAHEWSKRWESGSRRWKDGIYDAAETNTTWNNLRNRNERRLVTGAYVMRFAREDGWIPKAAGVIEIRKEDLIQNLESLDKAIASRAEELSVFRRGGLVVHIQPENEPAIFEGGKTEVRTRRVVQTTPAQMQQIAMRACAFESFDGRAKEMKRTQCPELLARHYLQMVMPSRVPVLRALTNHPTIRPDGSVLQEPGFDEATGLFYEPNVDFPEIPLSPTIEEAKEALARLKDVVRGFEFASDLDRAVWLAAVLTAIVRDSLLICPFYAFDAPLPGSGKTMLVSGVSVIALGFTATPTSQTDPDEERKTVASLLLRNAPFLFIDNCERPIQSSTLCEIATSPEWETRLLGTNIAPRLSTNITVMFTGNNLEIVGDIIERTLICRLQPTTDRPSERDYGWSFEGECRERRPELVAAALTVIRAYLASGVGDMGCKASRFPEWERLVRLPLMWLGEGDVVDTIERLRQVAMADDSDTQFLAKLVNAWFEEFGVLPVRLGEIGADSNSGRVLSLLSERFPGERFNINTRSAGKFLATHKGKIIEGKYFHRETDRKGISTWQIVEAPVGEQGSQ